MGLLEGKWIVFHHEVDSDKWPLLPFVRKSPFGEQYRKVWYDEDDLAVALRSEPCTAEEATGLPRDLLMGYQPVEVTLKRLCSLTD